MDIFTAIRERRSVREFEKKEIPDEAVRKLIDALLWAPSAGNLQSRKFYFVKDLPAKQKLAGAAFGQGFVASAPLVVVACADTEWVARKYGERGRELYCIVDAACSVMCLMLSAHGLGLGSVWVGAFNESEVAKVLGLPASLKPVALVPVGYPLMTPSPPKRVPTDEAIVFV
ncbi:MAG: nitroreductase family protein [Nitrospiraceae bacterium]|nr:nitroreductase family protein [Nitrospiraceae bacterium]